jgi:tripartite-type tricarboxylate transporter receptor subunit TctC
MFARICTALMLVFVPLMPEAGAQTKYPNGTVKIVAPYVPGGVADTAARVLAELLEARWKSPVIVENRAGAATVIGTNAVATATPDGHTLLLTATPFLVNPTLQPNLPFDTLRDFAGISMVVEQPVALVAHPSVSANTLQELVADAKARDLTLNFGSSGIGGLSHLFGELFARTAGIKLAHVPYRGSAGATVDLLAGHIPLVFDSGYSAKPHVDAGKLKILAISSAQRLPELPAVPTFAEMYPGLDASGVQILVAPGRTPKDVINKISVDVQAVVNSAAFSKKVKQVALDPIASNPETLDAFIRSEIERWAKVIRDSNIKATQ